MVMPTQQRQRWTAVIARSLMISAVTAAFSAPVLAQGGPESVTVAPSCSDSVGSGIYARCALWLEGRSLRRGTDAVPIARHGLFWPVRLTPYLMGDSARSYGQVYDRNARRANVLGLASVVLAVAAVAVPMSY